MREEITKYLSTVMQSTAKTIADKLCMDRLSVSRELNAMVSSGILERKLEGVGARHTEYVYWLTRNDAETAPEDGVGMHPKTLPASAAAAPKTASPTVEKPEVPDAEVSKVEEALDLALQLQAMTRERDQFKSQANALEDSALDLQLKLNQQTLVSRNILGERDKLRAILDECEAARDQYKARCVALQEQINQYDERQRFEAWFKTRPEFIGSADSTSLKEKMWESWLERSKQVEVAA